MNQPISPDVVSSHVTVRDGTRIGYNLYGGKENTVRVVLVHSLAMDRHFWTPVVERLRLRRFSMSVVMRRRPRFPVFALETLLPGPGLNQSAVDGEVLVGEQASLPGLRQHRRKESLGHLALQATRQPD